MKIKLKGLSLNVTAKYVDNIMILYIHIQYIDVNMHLKGYHITLTEPRRLLHKSGFFDVISYHIVT